jgi:hypothetical protein
MADQNPIPGDIVMPKEHEFDIAENEVFNGLAGSMGFCGIMSIIFGAIYSLQGLLSIGSIAGMITIGIGVVLILMGGWLWSASRSFKQIVRTEGSDITLLMHALRKLRSVYATQSVLYVLAILLIIGVVMLLLSHSPPR